LGVAEEPLGEGAEGAGVSAGEDGRAGEAEAAKLPSVGAGRGVGLACGGENEVVGRARQGVECGPGGTDVVKDPEGVRCDQDPDGGFEGAGEIEIGGGVGEGSERSAGGLEEQQRIVV